MPEIRKFKRAFNSEILCAAFWGMNLLVGTKNGLLLLDRTGVDGEGKVCCQCMRVWHCVFMMDLCGMLCVCVWQYVFMNDACCMVGYICAYIAPCVHDGCMLLGGMQVYPLVSRRRFTRIDVIDELGIMVHFALGFLVSLIMHFALCVYAQGRDSVK